MEDPYRTVDMPGRLEGRVALVSGTTQGFGRGILETFIREGAMVLGLDLQAKDGLVDGFNDKQAYQIQANVAAEDSWKRAVSVFIAASHSMFPTNRFFLAGNIDCTFWRSTLDCGS